MLPVNKEPCAQRAPRAPRALRWCRCFRFFRTFCAHFSRGAFGSVAACRRWEGVAAAPGEPCARACLFNERPANPPPGRISGSGPDMFSSSSLLLFSSASQQDTETICSFSYLPGDGTTGSLSCVGSSVYPPTPPHTHARTHVGLTLTRVYTNASHHVGHQDGFL